jgi:two-component system chemotaxis response regulator CheB
MAGHDLIVIGASAGGVEAMTELARKLPGDIPATVLVVVHAMSGSRGMLAHILARAGPLPASMAREGDPLQPGQIYVAPPNRHLLVRDGRVELSAGPRENHTRPAIDPLFRTAARAYGPRVVGVVLTGSLDDGTAGLLLIKQHGGLAVVQDPLTAAYPDMPRSAIENVAVDYVRRLEEIPELLVHLAHEPVPASAVESRSGAPDAPVVEVRDVQEDAAAMEQGEDASSPTLWTCPDCGGALWMIREGELVRFRCHMGHAFSPASLRSAQAERVEEALWGAVRALRERATFSRRLARRMRDSRVVHMVERYEEEAVLNDEQAQLVLQVIQGQVLGGHEPEEGV